MNKTEEKLLLDYDRMCGTENSLTEAQIRQLRIYYENLIVWNKVMNLTAITEEQEVYTKHFLDSLSIRYCKSVNLDEVHNIIDVGTGAGFPGLVLAVCYPNWKVTLLDSLKKRIGFLEDTVRKMELTNVNCIHARAEDGARDKALREKYDLAVARAVANISTLSEYCIPFVKPGGYFTAYKTESVEEEIKSSGKAIEKLGGEITSKTYFILGDTDMERCIVEIRKKKSTPDKYPRKSGTPSKEPLT